MKKKVIEFLQSVPVNPGDKILCAVSGGGDSLALLRLLVDVEERVGVLVAAAHYNHGLRPTADRDEEHVRNICMSWGIPFFSEQGDVRSAAQGRGIEETAREMRYEFLQRTAEENGCKWIATAHNADDVMETMIMNMARGSGSRGLAGIPPVRDNIIRPVLSFTGEELREFLDVRAVKYMHDETNDEPTCARNKVRLTVSPVLKEINPRAAKNASLAAKHLREDDECLNFMAQRELEKAEVSEEDGSIALKAERVLSLFPAVSGRLIMLAAEALGSEVNSAHVESVMAIAGGDDPSASVTLPDGIEAVRRYEDVVFREAKPEEAESIAPMTLSEGVNTVENSDIEVLVESGVKVYKSAMTFYLRRDSICGNLVLRSRAEGDRIKLPGRPSKTLKKLFIEEKIPADVRDYIMVFADDKGVVLLPDFGVDERCVPGEKDAAVSVTIRSAE